ncbi:MAG: DEAD/DEAH box helicase family protein [Chloroflexaceae bacterium]|nr:DEAD/DEAH box helicase family protein [Chloroflexaceae bacterium]
MITLYGHDTSDEYRHALRLRDLILQHWPHADTAPASACEIAIIAGAKCYGQRVVDIDLVLLINNADWRSYTTPAPSGTPGDSVYVHSLCLVIEIKQHQPEQVRFEGNRVAVTYRHEHQTHDVSAQSHKQKFALIDYIKGNGLAAPFVTNLIWLSNVPSDYLPTSTHNIISSTDTWTDWLLRVQHNQKPWRNRYSQPYGNQIRAGKQEITRQIGEVIALLTKRIEPSPLDRKRVERIVKGAMQSERTAYEQKLGQQLLVFRGRGGTGKTMRLLQIAYKLYHERGARVLILSYNHTLISDIRRTFSIMNISDPLNERSIVVTTVYSFMGSLLHSMGETTTTDDAAQFYQHYPHHVATLHTQLATDAITTTAIADLKRNHPALFDWDIVCIDEAQDWLTAERDILYHIYGHQRVIVADGIDQFVRSNQKTNWIETVPASERQIVTLHKALRLKAGLCAFVQAMAYEIHLDDWSIEPDSTLHGGRVLILEGPITDRSRDLFTALLTYHTRTGNRHVDMLMCVPPSLATTHAPSRVVARLHEWGYQSWDATHESTRGLPPLSADEVRLVQYDSCRGLEAWTVVHLFLDELYDYKYRQYHPPENRLDFFDEDEERRRHAARWLMIPLTRAIDTLVIHISDPQHTVARIVRAAASACGDAANVTWYRLPSPD